MSSSTSVGFTTGSSARKLRDCRTIDEAFQSSEFRDLVGRSLPKLISPDRMIRTFVQATSRAPMLLKCDMRTFVGACLTLAQLGLEPNTPLGHAYLIPFQTKRWNPQTRTRDVEGVDCNLIIGYPGLLNLAYRSPIVRSIDCRVVRWGEEFDYTFGSDAFLRHRPDRIDQAELRAAPKDQAFRCAYMYATLTDGFAMEVMSYAQVMERRAVSQGYMNAVRARDDAAAKGWRVPTAYTETPWVKNELAMARKTPLRSGANYLPRAVEMQAAAALEDAGDRRRGLRFDAAFDATSIDGETDYIGSTVAATDFHADDEQERDREVADSPARTTVQVRKEPEPDARDRPPATSEVRTTQPGQSGPPRESMWQQTQPPAPPPPAPAKEAKAAPEPAVFDEPLIDGWGEVVDGIGGDTFRDPVAWGKAFARAYTAQNGTPQIRDAMLETNEDALEKLREHPDARRIVSDALALMRPQDADSPPAPDPRDGEVPEDSDAPGFIPIEIPVDRGRPSHSAYARIFGQTITGISADDLDDWMDAQRNTVTTLPKAQLMLVVRSVVQAFAQIERPAPEWITRMVGARPADAAPPPSADVAATEPPTATTTDPREAEAPPPDAQPSGQLGFPSTDLSPEEQAGRYIAQIKGMATPEAVRVIARRADVQTNMRSWRRTHQELFAAVEAAINEKIAP